MTARKLVLASLLGLALVGAPLPARAQEPNAADTGKPEKLRDIHRLLELTGASKIGMQVMSQMVGQFRTMMPKVPAKFWDEFMKEANAEELVGLIVPIYDRRLTHDEVKAIIRFYETPAGRKLIASMPQITQESMQVGQVWGGQLGQKVQRRLRDQGYAP